MNKRIEKGITLIALIITIIVLLILAGVTISMLTGENGIITRASNVKIKTEIADVKEKIQIEILENQSENNGNISEDKLNEIISNYDKDNKIREDKEEKYIITEKGYEIKVSDIYRGTPVIINKSKANAPNLSKIAQKTYVTWNLNKDGTEYVPNYEQTTQPEDWYDYENGKWANIKTSQNGLEAYWVWIPRYQYIVPTSKESTEIDVKFIPTSKTTADEGYTIHPAFTNTGNGGFGELDGIWVGKFEASSNTANPDSNYGGGEPSDTNPLKVQVKPGVQSWRRILPKDIFTVCRKMTNEGEVLEGSIVDSHMMKNTEWGACAILSQSKYGIYNPQSSIEEPTDGTKRRIWNNPNGYYYHKYIYTGYAGDNEDASINEQSTTAPTDVIEYNKIDKENKLNGTKASTTGTVYGVYDMAGGIWEFVAGVLKGKSNELEYAKSIFDISNQSKPTGITEENFVKKYLDLYDYRTTSVDHTQYIVGDATVETKGWNSDFFAFNFSSRPLLMRGRLL